MKRTPVRKRRPGVRRGRIVDKDYLAWMHTQRGVVLGGKTHSVHHVRLCGSPKDDRRTLSMEYGYHQLYEGPNSIEALGKAKWQLLHMVNIEASIGWYQAKYLEQHPGVKW
jgi:hypothetical protein